MVPRTKVLFPPPIERLGSTLPDPRPREREGGASPRVTPGGEEDGLEASDPLPSSPPTRRQRPPAESTFYNLSNQSQAPRWGWGCGWPSINNLLGLLRGGEAEAGSIHLVGTRWDSQAAGASGGFTIFGRPLSLSESRHFLLAIVQCIFLSCVAKV